MQQIRELLIKKFGRGIKNHSDVLQLQEAIAKATGKRISSQTIKRVFGLIKSNSKADPATLDTLASYLSFTSYKDLLNWLEVSQKNTEDVEQEWASEIVLQILQDIKPENMHEPGLLQLVKNLFILFERRPELTSIIYPRLAASDFGRRYFFEQFIHYDAIAIHYGMGLEHYLIYEEVNEHRAFAYTMLCMRSFFTNDQQACRYYFSKVGAYNPEEIDNYHPFIIGRYYASRVYMNALEGVNAVAYVQEQVQLLMRTERKAFDLYHGFPCAELVFSEALVLTGHFLEAYQLLNNDKVKNYSHPPYMERGFNTHLSILYLLSGVYSGMVTKERGKKELEIIQKKPVYFLCKNYMQLFILLIKLKLDIQPRSTPRLIEETLAILKFSLPPAFKSP